MTGRPEIRLAGLDEALIEGHAALGTSDRIRRNRRAVARRFTRIYGGIDAWGKLPASERLAAPVVLRSYAAWAVVEDGCAVDADYVVGTPTKWAIHVQSREPAAHAELVAMATDLGFNPPEIKRICGRRWPNYR